MGKIQLIAEEKTTEWERRRAKIQKYLDVCITPLHITEMKFKLRTGRFWI